MTETCCRLIITGENCISKYYNQSVLTSEYVSVFTNIKKIPQKIHFSKIILQHLLVHQSYLILWTGTIFWHIDAGILIATSKQGQLDHIDFFFLLRGTIWRKEQEEESRGRGMSRNQNVFAKKRREGWRRGEVKEWEPNPQHGTD